jgi:hypothetical protein
MRQGSASARRGELTSLPRLGKIYMCTNYDCDMEVTLFEIFNTFGIQFRGRNKCVCHSEPVVGVKRLEWVIVAAIIFCHTARGFPPRGGFRELLIINNNFILGVNYYIILDKDGCSILCLNVTAVKSQTLCILCIYFK